jgi:hypothetical protein
MSAQPVGLARAHLRVRVANDQRAAVRELARRRRLSTSQLLRKMIDRELSDADAASGNLPDEAAIRDMAILIAVELVLKLQEASIPGGVTLSRRLLEDAARTAIERVEFVGLSLRREAER